MAIFCVTGKLGSGKTLACVGRIRDALLEGRKVATNLNLHLDKMLPCTLQHVDVVRLPDKPTVEDFEFIGRGNEEVDESKNGLIVLDELGAWFNARTWADKSRQAVIDWLLHSRKHGWDVYFIIQHPKMLDSQAREGLVEFLVNCRRMDRIRVPYIGALVGAITGKPLTMPKVHIATVRYGMEPHAMVADRWIYRAHDLYAAYDTRQVFTDQRVEPYRLTWTPRRRVSFWERITTPPPLVVKHKPKPKLLAQLAKLPDPKKRMELFRKFEQTGTFARAQVQQGGTGSAPAAN